MGDSGTLQFLSDSRKLKEEIELGVKASEGLTVSEIFKTASVIFVLPTGIWRSPRRLIFSLEVLLKEVSLNKLGRGLRLP